MYQVLSKEKKKIYLQMWINKSMFTINEPESSV